MKKTYIVTDLGPGDGGKGGVVHRLAQLPGVHTIIKVGGAQGSHGVRNSSGQSFAFSQFGCGTLEGVRTHISSRFVCDPLTLLREAQALRFEAGVHNPFSLLTVDARSLCNIPYYGIASRLKELALRDAPRGTVGTGVGQTVRIAALRPDLALHARDLRDASVYQEKIAAVREFVRTDLAPLRGHEFLPADAAMVAREWALLDDPGFLTWTFEQFATAAKALTITNDDYFSSVVLATSGLTVVESSHGILTDAYTGFHPHTSALRTLPQFADGMLRTAGFDGDIVHIGVHRAYQVRHGAGPMPTHQPEHIHDLLPGSHKDDNRYQGQSRVGALDTVALRYAMAACGPYVHALAITWFDQVARFGRWDIATAYRGGDSNYCTEDGRLRLRVGDDAAQLAYLDGMTAMLARCVPDIISYQLPTEQTTPDAKFDYVAATLAEHLSVPVRMVSLGPTERDKVLK